MEILTIIEKDGTKTRVPVELEAIANEIANYFKDDIELVVERIKANRNIIIDENEKERAEKYITEWRSFGRNLRIVNN